MNTFMAFKGKIWKITPGRFRNKLRPANTYDELRVLSAMAQAGVSPVAYQHIETTDNSMRIMTDAGMFKEEQGVCSWCGVEGSIFYPIGILFEVVHPSKRIPRCEHCIMEEATGEG